jgi:signal peptidase I
MEDTLYTDERIIVNRLPVTGAILTGQQYTPERGQVVVFKNPQYQPGMADEYIVKRVIGLPGERVTVNACEARVFNHEHTQGFDPYTAFDVSDHQACVSGNGIDITVPSGEIFVIGDHRTGNYSLDSRNGLSTIPLEDVVGPVSLRVWPLDQWRGF